MKVITLLGITFILSFVDIPILNTVLSSWQAFGNVVGDRVAVKIKDYITFLTGIVVGALLLLWSYSIAVGTLIRRDARLDETDIIAMKVKKDSKTIIKVPNKLNSAEQIFYTVLTVYILRFVPIKHIQITHSRKYTTIFWIMISILMLLIWFGLRSAHVEIKDNY